MTYHYPNQKQLPTGQLIDMLGTMAMVHAWGVNGQAPWDEVAIIYDQLVVFGENDGQAVPPFIWCPFCHENLRWDLWLAKRGSRFIRQEN